MILLGSKVCGWLGAVGLMVTPVFFGCGGKVLEDDGGGGAATSSGGPSTTNVGTTTGKGSTATGSVCDATNDQASNASVTFSVVNNGFEPIYLPTHCGAIAYSVRDLDAPSEVSFPGYRSCLQTCEDLRTSGHLDCGACAPASYLLEPGQKITVVWDGLGLLDTTMPVSCFDQPNEGDQCARLVAASVADRFEVSFQGYRSCGQGTCVCDDEGRCDDTATGQTTFPNGVTFSLTPSSFVEVSFDSCAFGCAGD